MAWSRDARPMTSKHLRTMLEFACPCFFSINIIPSVSIHRKFAVSLFYVPFCFQDQDIFERRPGMLWSNIRIKLTNIISKLCYLEFLWTPPKSWLPIAKYSPKYITMAKWPFHTTDFHAITPKIAALCRKVVVSPLPNVCFVFPTAEIDRNDGLRATSPKATFKVKKFAFLSLRFFELTFCFWILSLRLSSILTCSIWFYHFCLFACDFLLSCFFFTFYIFNYFLLAFCSFDFYVFWLLVFWLSVFWRCHLTFFSGYPVTTLPSLPYLWLPSLRLR